MKILLISFFCLKFSYAFQWTSISSTFQGFQWSFWDNCCQDHEFLADFDKLHQNLKDKIYGQPFIEKYLVNILKNHWFSKKSTKALSLSFHGGPGVGKNYVAEHIMKSLYTNGALNRHVHYFTARIHFPEESEAENYKKNLVEWIKGNTTICDKQLFVFDEVDKMAPGILDGIKPYIDYIEFIDGISYHKCIFIFLSNTGSQVIANYALDFWKNGIMRDNFKITDFEKKLLQESYNVKGGFYYSDNIKYDLIDHFIPFLPLDQENVRKCIIDEFKRQQETDPTEDQIRDVLETLDWGPEPDNIFSKTGCKRIQQKVLLVI